jgi:CRP/FNR family cyclic AMP-dependent transcriptional regulator
MVATDASLMPQRSGFRAIPLFATLRDEDLDRIVQAGAVRSYSKGSIIASEGTPEDTLCVVINGRARIVQIAEDGREVILGVRGPGEFFGEMALLGDVPRMAHVIAAEPAKVLMVHRAAFQRLVNDVPGIAVGLLRAMCRRMYQAQQRIGGMALLDVHGRLARALIDHADERDGSFIGPDITHNVIAQLIGASRETVSRALSRFSERGWVRTQRRRIEIVDRPALVRAAGLDTGRRDRRSTDPGRQHQARQAPEPEPPRS